MTIIASQDLNDLTNGPITTVGGTLGTPNSVVATHVDDQTPAALQPDAINDTLVIDEDSAATIRVLDNDITPADDRVTISAINGVEQFFQTVSSAPRSVVLSSGAIVSRQNDGTLTYNTNGVFDDLEPGQTVFESFTYTVRTDAGLTDTATVNVAVEGRSETPRVTIASQGFNALIADPVTDDFFSGFSGTYTNAGSQNIGGPGLDFTGTWGLVKPFVPGGPAGFGDEDAFGVNSFGGNNAPDVAPGGTPLQVNVEHNFVINDTDGLSRLVFEPVDVRGFTDRQISLNYWIAPGATYDELDQFSIAVRSQDNTGVTSGSTIALQFESEDVDAFRSADDGTDTWRHLTIDLDYLLAEQGLNEENVILDIGVLTNGDQESIFIDNVTFTAAAPLNEPPHAEDDEATLAEDQPTDLDVTANDRDPNGDRLSIVQVNGADITDGAVTLASGAVVTLTSTGSLLYDPRAAFAPLAPGESEPDSFTYTVADPAGAMDTATVALTVTGVNSAPVLGPDRAATTESTLIRFDPLANDADPEGDALSLLQVNGLDATAGKPITLSSGAMVRLMADGTLTYDPNNAFDGLFARQRVDETFTYTVADAGGQTATGTITITVSGEGALPFEAVAAYPFTNTPEPILLDDSGNRNDGRLENGAALTPEGIAGAGVAFDGINDYALLPATDDFDLADGAVSFWFQTDRGGTDQALISRDAFGFGNGGHFTVTSLGDARVQARLQTTDSTATLQSEAAAAGDWHHVVVNWGDETGFQLFLNGALAAEDTGVQGGLTGNGNDFTFGAGQITSTEGTLDPLTQFFDGTLDEVGFYTDGLSTEDVELLYQFGLDGIEVIGARNRLPEAVDDTAVTTEDDNVVIDVLENDTDENGDALRVTRLNDIVVSAEGAGIVLASGAVVSLTAEGTVHYEVADSAQALTDGDSAVDSFIYTVEDGQGGTATASVDVTVTGVNDAPVANDDVVATDEDTAVMVNVLTNDQDSDDIFLAPTLVNGSGAEGGAPIRLPSGAFVTVGSGGLVTYDPARAFAALGEGEEAEDRFTYSLIDSGGAQADASVTVAITGRNDAPIAQNDTAQADEKTPVAIPVLANDSDVDGTISIATVNEAALKPGDSILLTSGALVTLSADGTLTYDPNGAFEDLGADMMVEDRFDYTIVDNAGATARAQATVTVEGLAEAPVFDLAAYWPGGEADGRFLRDETLNDLDGGLQGGAMQTADGFVGAGLRFDGSDDAAIIPHDDRLLLDGGGVSLWFYADNLAGDQGLFSKDASFNGTGGHLDLRLLNGGVLWLRLQNADSALDQVLVIDDVQANTWTHAVVSWGNDGLSLSVNGGAETATSAYTGGLGDTSGGAGNFEPIAIGATERSSGTLSAQPLTQFFDGQIDEVAVLASQPDAAIITALYEAGLSGSALLEGPTDPVVAAEEAPLTAWLAQGADFGHNLRHYIQDSGEGYAARMSAVEDFLALMSASVDEPDL